MTIWKEWQLSDPELLGYSSLIKLPTRLRQSLSKEHQRSYFKCHFPGPPSFSCPSQEPQLSDTLFFLTHPESNGQLLTGLSKLRKAGFAIPRCSDPSESRPEGRAGPGGPWGAPGAIPGGRGWDRPSLPATGSWERGPLLGIHYWERAAF